MEHPFRGRSISVVHDLSVDEQAYLYEKTRELKKAVLEGKDTGMFSLNDPDFSIYLMFLEDSTRTKESFQNAARFHGTRVNVFDARSSSFNKNESITDTVKMLFGYAQRSLFIVRSKQEGLCTWLDQALGEYAAAIGYPKPPFINAGDGKHEHPTQEFLDEFSFLEQLNWDRSSIHLALVGDLFHGRTIHSKADGLRIFSRVRVDLVAPDLLAMPEYYIHKMEANGYDVRIFPSIEAYLASGDFADIWYFTRLQLERMGDEVLDKADLLRASVTFRKEDLVRLRENTRFYHPLPRHRVHPVIPSFLDHLPLNGWDRQSINGYFTRIIEIAMLSGKIGSDFSGKSSDARNFDDDFVEEVKVVPRPKQEYKIGIKPVENGIVIDHIARGREIRDIWNHIDKIRHIIGLNCRSSHGVYHTDDPQYYKGIISLPGILSFDDRDLKKLAAIAPGCTLNIIKDSKVTNKYRLHIPPRLYNFDEISCKNENCISAAANHEPVPAEFYRSKDNSFICKFCEKEHKFQEAWDI
ncbi:MAG: aspartate carbamoyltransferase [Spirochaetales bacterium]|nr:aspartate carbamoyltransferase [Spirochaetales bacterium]